MFGNHIVEKRGNTISDYIRVIKIDPLIIDAIYFFLTSEPPEPGICMSKSKIESSEKLVVYLPKNVKHQSTSFKHNPGSIGTNGPHILGTEMVDFGVCNADDSLLPEKKAIYAYYYTPSVLVK